MCIRDRLLAAFVSSGIANVVRPNLIHDEILGLASVTLPWGEQLAYVEATDSLWATVFLAANLITIGYVLVACTLQFRRGERWSALVLGSGMAWFIMTVIVDILVDLGIAPLYLGDFGFLGLAIALGLQLTNDVIRTEEELTRYRRNLEGMVQDRTVELRDVNADLTQANEQLAQEIASRMQTEETLRQRVQEMAGLNRIANTLSTVTELPAALELLCEMIADLFLAQRAYIVSTSAEGAGLQVLVGYEHGTGTVGPLPLPVPLAEMKYFGQVLDDAESLVLSDLASLPMAAPMHDFVTSQGLQNAMVVPLVVRGSALGLLAVATDQAGHVFDPDQLRLAETIAADVAGAIENARLFEQAQVVAIGEERARIARDLHDSVTQSIYSASLIAEALPGVWQRSPDQVRGNLITLLQLIRGALAEMRTLLFELRPSALEEASLGRLLHQLADVLTGRTRIPVEVTVQGQEELPTQTKIALYRIAQEVFNNIAKHARATKATATLQNQPGTVLLTIQDNGQGFDPASIPAERMGVRIMYERAQAIGAEMVVETELGRGARVSVAWQVDDRRRTDDKRRRTTDDGRLTMDG